MWHSRPPAVHRNWARSPYDAFGNLIEQTDATPNVYLYAGEQFDPDLNLYYNRAGYLDVRNGRFWGMDPKIGPGVLTMIPW